MNGITAIPMQINHGGLIAVNTTVVHYCPMSRDDPQFKLRLPPALKAQIDQAAAENRRSLNAEIVARLEESFEVKAAQVSVLAGGSSDQVIQMLSVLRMELSELRTVVQNQQVKDICLSKS